ncbi:MAG: hypothetical protein KGL11_06625 [Alphaproteobacteria bacterium]|nr:hypothetical protein [Alphaproteobacteria bacterium]
MKSPVSGRMKVGFNPMAARHAPYDDLRGWIDEARKLGKIREVKGPSWREDIGMADLRFAESILI